MTGNVLTLNDYRQCECLGTVDIHRQPDGSIILGITYMDNRQIESAATIAERFDIIEGWLTRGLPSLKEQARELSE